jgi:hypothetical protein
MKREPKHKDWPHWLRKYPTRRKWREQKRRDAADAERAVQKLLIGAAFTPMRGVGTMLAQVREYRQQMSVKQWGRG